VLETVGRYLQWVLPSQSQGIVEELGVFLAHKEIVGWVLLVTMLFFSTLAFTVLENAMSVIFVHRVATGAGRSSRRRAAVLLHLCLALGLLVVTLVAGGLQALGRKRADFSAAWSLDGVSGAAAVPARAGGEMFVLTSVYLVMPVGSCRCAMR
jgi:uncharacterized BrkB/YihY/UPF0761 family membrane protein